MTARMLRRSVAAFIACAGVIAVTGCGIKGPLKLPPGASAPAPTGAPPGAIPTESPTTSPQPPAPAASTTPSSDKDGKE